MFPIVLAGEMEELFTALLYGGGNWIGLLVISTLVAGLTLKWKYAGLVCMAATIFIGINYLEHDLGWNALIMFLETIFILGYLAEGKFRG